MTSFILEPSVDLERGNNTPSLTINPEGYLLQDSPFENLLAAISWAIDHDEDLIYCICGNDATVNLDFDSLEEVLLNIIPERINLLYIDVKCKRAIRIDQYCMVIEGIESISSFVLAKPIFKFALSILQNRSEVIDMTWLDLMGFIAPHSFTFLPQKNKEPYSPKFHIVSPFRNASAYLNDYLQAVDSQVCRNFKVYLIDDCSEDGSADLIPQSEKIARVVNDERKYALQNIVDVLLNQDIGDEDIICLVDADDRLAHKYVLSLLAEVYADKNIMMTYGSLQYLDGHQRYGSPYTYEEFVDLRKSDWRGYHLRTFKYKLFKELMRQDPDLNNLRDPEGNMLRMPYDMALLFPLMELAGFERIRFIHTPLYHYRLHEQNDQYVNRSEQYAGELVIRKKSRLNEVLF